MAIKVPLSQKSRNLLRYNGAVTWVYLSPHFDDVALSCGGLVWEQARTGELVSIWTICAGEPPGSELSPFAKALHTRWETDQNAPTQRRHEDERSCRRLGARHRYFSIPDCIYRRHPQTLAFMYASEEALNGPLDPGDKAVMRSLRLRIKRYLPPDSILVCPLALGNHVDHQLTRQACEGRSYPLWYYADYPYVLRSPALLEHLPSQGWTSQVFPISADGLAAWMDSISAYGSQISTFWASDHEMRRAIADYWHSTGGIRLWKRPVT